MIKKVDRIEDVIPEGVTMPLRCSMDGGTEIIVKYPKNPYGTEVLINEWIGNCLAKKIGLSVPDFGLCDLSEDVFDNSDLYPEMEVDKRNCGISFYSKKLPNISLVNDKLLKQVVNKETEKIILFDLLVKVRDRHKGNIVCSLSNCVTMYCIDCSHIFASDDYRLDSPLKLKYELSHDQLTNTDILHKNDIYNRMCRNVGYSENILFDEADKIKKMINDKVLDDFLTDIPNSWKTENTQQRIKDIKQIILEKISNIELIAESVASDRRNTQWKK